MLAALVAVLRSLALICWASAAIHYTINGMGPDPSLLWNAALCTRSSAAMTASRFQTLESRVGDPAQQVLAGSSGSPTEFLVGAAAATSRPLLRNDDRTDDAVR